MKMEGVNTEMIILAREARGLNQARLAEELDMSAANMAKIEGSGVGVTKEKVEEIAGATDYPVHFFLQHGKAVPENLAWRRRRNVPQKLLSPVYAKANIMRRHVQVMSGALQLPVQVLPSYPVTETQTPAKSAVKIRQLWKIEDISKTSLIKTVENNGVVISSFDFGTERIDSLTMLTDNGQPVIFINKTLAGDRQRFTVAYELGHLLMHTFCELQPGQDVTTEANNFAAELLMPAKEIRKDFADGITIELLATLKKKWKVSMIALLYRADDLGYLTANQKRYLLQRFNEQKIRRREPPELDIASEQPSLMKYRIAQYRMKTKLSSSEMAELLCLQVDEFIELYS